MKENQEGLVTLSNPPAETTVGIIGLKAGLITFASLTTYFFVMKYGGFTSSATAWSLNFVILWSGIILAYRYYRSKTKLNIEYIPGLILGGATTAAGVFPYMIFLYLYFLQADASSILLLKDTSLFLGGEITPVQIAASAMVEGIFSGVIISFIMMQYYRSGFRRSRREKKMHG